VYQREQPSPEFKVVSESAEKAPDFARTPEEIQAEKSIEVQGSSSSFSQEPIAQSPEIYSEAFSAPSSPEAIKEVPKKEESPNHIDKRFVNKTKAIIKNLGDKPFEAERTHSQLQAEYIWERFGRRLKSKD